MLNNSLRNYQTAPVRHSRRVSGCARKTPRVGMTRHADAYPNAAGFVKLLVGPPFEYAPVTRATRRLCPAALVRHSSAHETPSQGRSMRLNTPSQAPRRVCLSLHRRVTGGVS